MNGSHGDSPLVSVILPAYNHEKYVQATIQPKPLSSQTNEGFYGKLTTEQHYIKNIKNLTTKT